MKEEDGNMPSVWQKLEIQLPSSRLQRKTYCRLSGQRLALIQPLERLRHRAIVIVDKGEDSGFQGLNAGE